MKPKSIYAAFAIVIALCLVSTIIFGVVGCGKKEDKKLIVVIDDERCGNKMRIYSLGGRVIVDSLDRSVLPIDVPIYIVSHKTDSISK